MGDSSPGALGYYCCHKLKRTAWRLWSSLLGQDLVTSKYSTFVIMTKTHCSSHCAKINQPSWHSWVSDSRGQWVSLGRNCFLFHRLRDTVSVGDTLILFCFPGVWELACKLCSLHKPVIPELMGGAASSISSSIKAPRLPLWYEEFLAAVFELEESVRNPGTPGWVMNS